jgi:Ca2+-binding EF-hand superfamily protein
MRIPLILAAATVGLFALPAQAQHAGNAFLAAYDTNKDGKLPRAEYDAARAERFAATDANHDGAISEAEYVGEFAARLDKQLAASGDSAEKQAEERTRQIRQTHVRFGVLDTSKDGRIDRAEYDAIADKSFAEQDADKDGVITAADVAATAAARRAN